MNKVDWGYYKRFEELNERYLPDTGEGDTRATQACTAINKLVYKWYNDHDVFDNAHSGLVGWANDISSYANWLYVFFDCDFLKDVYNCAEDDEYELLLQKTADFVFSKLDDVANSPKVGSVYECEGPFEFELADEDEEDYWEDDEDLEDEDEED